VAKGEYTSNLEAKYSREEMKQKDREYSLKPAVENSPALKVTRLSRRGLVQPEEEKAERGP